MVNRRKTSRRSRRKNFVAIPYQDTLTLAALADNTVFEAAVIPALGEDLYILSVDSQFSLIGHTAGEGPISVGFNHGDLTATEIQESLNAELTDPDDIIAKERARRPVRKTGYFDGLTTNERLNNGANLRTKLRFSVGNDHTLGAWAWNTSGAALTTGSLVKVQGTIYGRWQR